MSSEDRHEASILREAPWNTGMSLFLILLARSGSGSLEQD
jgi:hypothetical protein